MNTSLLTALRNAEALAFNSLPRINSKEAKAVHHAIALALHIAERQAAGPHCEAPTCENPVEYSGIGRHRRFCSDRCRKAAHRARRQRGNSEEGRSN